MACFDLDCAVSESCSPKGQRRGSWCSRYCSRVIQPKIMDFVIKNFSGLTAKYTWTRTSATKPVPASPCNTYIQPHVESLKRYGLRVKKGVCTRLIINTPVTTT